jgi:hypothetical protein
MLDGLGNAYANWLPQYYSQQLDYGGKNGLFEPFIHFLKMLILPRQARDKHREKLKKCPFGLRRPRVHGDHDRTADADWSDFGCARRAGG